MREILVGRWDMGGFRGVFRSGFWDIYGEGVRI